MKIRMIALAVCAACSTARPGAPAAPRTPLVGVAWRLAEIAGRPARISGGEAPTLALSPEGRATGNTGCNGYSGPYTLEGESLGFGALVSTRRACVDPEMNRQETALIRALSATRRWRTAGDTLVLSGDSAEVRFIR
jgi:heat shock protein HslJ